jgi:hypothetical protein
MSVSTSARRLTSRRVVTFACLLATAVSFFTLGVIHARGNDAVAQRLELQSEVRKTSRREPVVAGATVGRVVAQKDEPVDIPTPAARAKLVAEIKQEIQDEMGLLPVHLLRERRSSFVELYAYDNSGKTNYGTAGYLGSGYFVTVKHAVVALTGDNERGTRKMTSVKVVYKGKEIPAASSTRAMPTSKSTAATGRSSRRKSSTCRPFTSTRRSPTILPTPSSVSVTIIRKGSSSRPVTSDSGRPTAS